MHTKNMLRRHFVLADTVKSADPILQRLNDQGIPRYRTHYLSGPTDLIGLSAKDCAFIFGPNWENHPFADQIMDSVWRYIREGAVVKADPVAEFEAAMRRKAEERRNREARERTAQVLADVRRFAEMQMSRSSAFGSQAQFQATETRKRYKQYLLGGPAHAHRYVGLQVVEENRQVEINGVVYRSYVAEVLGEKITFWIYAPDWDERARLVREFVLLALEA